MRAGRRQKLTSIRAYLAAVAVLVGFIVVAGATAARAELRNERPITEGLIATAIAYEIGERCDSLDARLVAGVNYLWSLRRQASDLGYSDAEIDAYVDDRDEQRRLEAIARDRLRSMGAIPGEWSTYCTVGEAEIAADSRIGRLLR